jgi:hypothetical protein
MQGLARNRHRKGFLDAIELDIREAGAVLARDKGLAGGLAFGGFAFCVAASASAVASCASAASAAASGASFVLIGPMVILLGG